jgi:excisionase family DNA binding protein
MERYLRPSEVARQLKLNTETVYHYIKKGDLPAARLGRKYIVTEKDLEAFIERRKEANRIEKLDLSEKGKKMIEQVKANADRVLDFIEEYPGATRAEITEALVINAEDVDRALRRLQGKEMARPETAEGAEESETRWYVGSEESEQQSPSRRKKSLKE